VLLARGNVTVSSALAGRGDATKCVLGRARGSHREPFEPEPDARRLNEIRGPELLVVVQAVAGSSPVAHPHEVAAHQVFLRQRYFDSAGTELPMSYQFFGGGGVSSCSSVRLGLRGARRHVAAYPTSTFGRRPSFGAGVALRRTELHPGGSGRGAARNGLSAEHVRFSRRAGLPGRHRDAPRGGSP
jgi:hypothetical protein